MNFISHAFHKVQSKNWPFVYFAIDIHDTIFKGTYKKNNEGKQFYPWAKEVLQNLTLNPKVKLIVYTSSHEGPARDVIAWLKEHHIEIFAFNGNPDHTGTDLCDFSKKFYFDILLEDKAGFEGWHDWFKIMKELQACGQWIDFYSDDGIEVSEPDDKGGWKVVYRGESTKDHVQRHRIGTCTSDCPVCNFAGDQYFLDEERKRNER